MAGTLRLNNTSNTGQTQLSSIATTDRTINLPDADGTLLISTLTTQTPLPDGTEAAPGITFANDLDTGIYRPGTNEIGLVTGASEALRIDDAGNVGIGTTSPGVLLELGTATPILRFSDTDTTGYHQIQSSNANFIINADPSNQTTNSSISFNVDGSERARIDNEGRLLVGTASARTIGTGNFQIQAEGTGVEAGISTTRNTDNSSGPNFRFVKSRGTTDGSNTSVNDDDTLGQLGWWGTDGTSAVEAASITAEVDGPVGTNDMPSRLMFSTRLREGSDTVERIRINNTGDTNFYTDHTNVHIARSGNAAGTSNSIYVGVRSATNVVNGTVVYRVYTNGTFATISDANQKKNIETTRDGYLEDLNRLRVVKYNWNEQVDSEPKELGLIAQEVEEVFPGLVTEISESSEESEFKGIKTSVLPYMLLKALQEATTRIETLEAKVTALEGV